MSKEITNLEPKALWEHFYQLTQIPRPSKKEARIQEFMMNFGKSLGLETIKDATGNIIIRKPATPGMENRKGVVLQGHLDMVPQKNNDTRHDFENDPIDAYIDGDWVTAKGTTLGADNGIGVAAAMTVLADKTMQHGPIEALFTCDEETGMTGAFGLKGDVLKGDILLNMDSEDEGELYVGCAGGVDANIKFEFDQVVVPSGVKAFDLVVSGLKGGHSGMDIILGLGNANKLLVRFLKHAVTELDVRLAEINAGGLRNAIPREGSVRVVVPEENVDALKKAVAEYEAIYKTELSSREPNLSFVAKEADMPKSLIDEAVQDGLIDSVNACPNGVIRMSDDVPGLVETSTNLASIKSENGTVSIQCLLRSSVDSAKQYLSERIDSVFSLAGATVVFAGGYPGWKPNMASPILKQMQQIYNDKFGKVPEIKAIHAGLECGLLGAVYPNWDMISFGPTIRSPHSPDEKVYIESVKKFWDFLVETLKSVEEK
ncbi:aminoacyl-histidine dipeptidase [Prolixibacter sp. SD074]|jgi:dipeptidase D|uniref:aminoacyl-histidine dipeptidase n=1 Tax=Prolixibacter sp. SD074 TaxID=2652391 RepID=UPI00126C8220|nr:aminoacyl-histidine dipeptidase [Prolixibacter sp. SD074]GET29902.1 aminoacyl-histidine dipeptidase [Prolixibacter sp. SD074]